MSLLHPIIRKVLGAFRWNLLLANIFSIAELWSNSSCGAECHKHQGHTKRNMWNKPRAFYLLFVYAKTPFERDVLDFWYLKSIGYNQLLKQKEKSFSNCWLLMDQFLYHFARVLIASKLAPKNCIPYSIDSFLSSPLIPPSCYVQITIIVFGQFSYSLFLLGNGPFCTVQCKSRKPWVLEANCQNIVP